MPTAEGFFKSTAGGRFACTLLVDDDMMYHFSGTFASSVQAFTANIATVTYTSLNQLVSSRSFAGRVGPDNITLTLANGPVIEGVLDMPIQGATVSGSGVWTH
ncbi:hypothetical protein B0H34DRAFT_691345 [Crassisporium funariophilum]|nr:hypothetical protein B0H34DRAFT_691345 [Crassisporium funariophilum]